MAIAYSLACPADPSDFNHRQTEDIAIKAYTHVGRALDSYLRANLRCDEDAQDMAQEVYLRIVRYPNLSDVQSLKAFVFTIARNLLRDKSRRCATKLSACSISDDSVTLVADGSDPIEELEAEECMRRIETVMRELNPTCRQAFVLNRTFDMSYSAIASHMGVSVSMVEKHISTALSALRSACQFQ